MQHQIDALSETLNRYIARSESSQVRFFSILEKAAEERKRILIQTTKTNGRVNKLEDICGRQDRRMIKMEDEQKSTLTFKGKMAVVVGISITVIGGGLLALLKAHI